MQQAGSLPSQTFLTPPKGNSSGCSSDGRWLARYELAYQFKHGEIMRNHCHCRRVKADIETHTNMRSKIWWHPSASASHLAGQRLPLFRVLLAWLSRVRTGFPIYGLASVVHLYGIMVTKSNSHNDCNTIGTCTPIAERLSDSISLGSKEKNCSID